MDERGFFGLMGVLHLAGLWAVAPELWRGMRRDRGLRAAILLLAMAAAWSWGQWMPAGWVTSLREGFTRDHLRFVAGLGTHAGPLLQGFWVPALGLGGLRDLVSFNLALTALDLGLFVLVGGRRLGAAAWLLAGAWLLRPLGLSVALSETEAPLTTAWLLGAVWATGAVHEAPRRRLALGVATLVLAACRVELALLPGLLLLVDLGRRGLQPLEDRWARGLDRLAASPLAAPLAAFAVAGWLWLGERVVRWSPVDGVRGDLGWALDAADPLNTRLLLLVPAAMAVLSPAAVLLAVVGLALGLRRPLRHGLWAPGLGLLFGTWYLAAHGATHGSVGTVSSWELARYLELAAPVLLLFAGRGLLALPARWRPWLAALCLLPPIPALMDTLRPAFGDAGRPPAWGRVDQDAQREVRLLLELAERHPECAILTRALPWSGRDRGGELMWTALVPWRGGWRVRDDWRFEGGRVVGEQVPRCVLGVRSLDCAAAGRAGCGWLDGREALVEASWEHRPYVHPAHGATWSGTVTWGACSLQRP